MKRFIIIAAALLFAAPYPTSAQTWPSKPIRYIVIFVLVDTTLAEPP